MRHAKICQTIALRPKNDIYVFAVSPIDATSCLSVCSDDQITAVDIEASKPLWSIPTQHSGTNQALIKSIDDRPVILTTGNDGTIKIWDPRSSTSSAIQNLTHSTAPLLSLASHPTSSVIAAGSELTGQDAVIQFSDLRSPGDILHKYTESHSDDITDLHYHSTNATCLLSGSTDGLINIYDTTIADEDDAVYQVLNHKSAIHHSGFLEDEIVYGLSTDEQLSLYKLSDPAVVSEEEDPSVCVFGDVREVLGCDYVVDLNVTGGGPIICAGSFSQGRLDLIPLKKTPAWDYQQQDTIRLDKGLGDEVVRDLYLDERNERVIAGAEDNLIRIWSEFA